MKMIELRYFTPDLSDNNLCWLRDISQRKISHRAPKLASELLRIIKREEQRRSNDDEPELPRIDSVGWTNREVADALFVIDALAEIATGEPKGFLESIRRLVNIIAVNRLRDTITPM